MTGFDKDDFAFENITKQMFRDLKIDRFTEPIVEIPLEKVMLLPILEMRPLDYVII